MTTLGVGGEEKEIQLQFIVHNIAAQILFTSAKREKFTKLFVDEGVKCVCVLQVRERVKEKIHSRVTRLLYIVIHYRFSVEKNFLSGLIRM